MINEIPETLGDASRGRHFFQGSLKPLWKDSDFCIETAPDTLLSMRFRPQYIACILCFFLQGAPVFAAETYITPVRALSSDQYTILSQYRESADGTVEGAGAFLKISYTSSVDLNGYVAIMNNDLTYNPAEMNSFTLPANKEGVAIVDLRTLPTWTPSDHTFYLSFLSSTVQTDTQFQEMSLIAPKFTDTITASFLHLFATEPYWVSSAHLLRGYSMLHISASMILGIILLLWIIIILLKKRSLGTPLILTSIIAASLLYSARVAVDLTLHTINHVKEWTTDYTYTQAGDLYSIADVIKKDPSAKSISVCFSSTDYYAKLLRYLVYPIPVKLEGTLTPDTTHVLVTHDLNWTEKDERLVCGSIDVPATLIKKFDDGSVLYSITRKQ